MAQGPRIVEFSKRPILGVMGPSTCTAELSRLAREVGRLIGREGGILICGGGSGVMAAAAQGAREAGGLTVGILPGERASEANPHIDLPIVTGLGNARNVVNVLTSQAIIAVGGQSGTLSEIALALKCGTPVVGLGTWSLVPPPGVPRPRIVQASSPEEAVRQALLLARGNEPEPPKPES